MSRTGRKQRRRLRRLGLYQNDLCFYCDEPVIYSDPEIKLAFNPNGPRHASFGHYVSRHLGGSNHMANSVVAHRQCNSEAGHEPTPELDEKFHKLNILRGYDVEGLDDPRLISRLDPTTFSKPSPALEYLCDSANAIVGEEGVRIREKIIRRLQSTINLINGLRNVPNASLRQEALIAIIERRATDTDTFPPKLSTLLDNVIRMLIREDYRRNFSD